MFALLSAAMGIVLVDLLLSGDNALVIGTAAAGLARRQRLLAILFGGIAAIMLRIGFSLASTVVLNLPWIQTIGGVVLLIIAIRLLADREHETSETQERQQRKQSLWMAILTILVADLTMSLDNILAVGAIANGNLLLLTVGVLLSVILLLVGSVIVSELVGRLSWLIDIAALVLAWTSAGMIRDDLKQNISYLAHIQWFPILVPIVGLSIVIVADIYLRVRAYRHHHAQEQ